MRKKIFILICILAAAPCFLQAQSIAGSWFGRADVELAGIHNNYLTELVLKQKGNRVEGIFGYYFRDKYQSFLVHGTYDPNTREITILNIPLIYYNSSSTVNGIDCIMNFRAKVIRSRAGSSLSGSYFHDAKYKYLCPDLKATYELDRNDHEQDSTLTASSSQYWKPQTDDYVVNEVKAPPVTAVQPDSVSTSKTAVANVAPEAVTPAAPVIPKPDSLKADSAAITASFAKRKAILHKELLVESDSVRLSFYDNGEIDGDSISVFVNNELVLSHQGLEARAFNVYLHLDSTRDVNEISMFAENLGKLPPNTALMVVTDGKNRYEVFLSSTLTENATVELRRKRP